MSEYPSFSEPPSNSDSLLPNSTLAIVSLIAGILGLTALPLIGSITALITGSMAKNEIEESAGMIGGGGMAQAGLIMGWIGVGIGLLGCCIAAFVIAVSLGMFGIAFQDFSALSSFVL